MLRTHGRKLFRVLTSTAVTMATSGRTTGRSLSGGSNVKTIGTHDGRFHCDEVLAVAMLKLLPDFADAQVIRTRDTELLKTCDIVVDVGGLFDPATLRFDHHQRSFEHSMSTLCPGKPWVTKLSSAGLVYVHYGEAVIAQVLSKSKGDEIVSKLYDKMYENFIEEIDAVDNGISVSDGKLKYRITTTLAFRVGRLNPFFTDRVPDSADEMSGFNKALEVVGTEFVARIHDYAGLWWESYSVVVAAFNARFEVHGSGEIMEFPNGGVPWKEHLAELEGSKEGDEGTVKFVIFPDLKGMWRVQAVPVTPESFDLKVPLCKEWQGIRDKELQDLSNIPTATFVHANGFIGGAAERSDVLNMAETSIQKSKS